MDRSQRPVEAAGFIVGTVIADVLATLPPYPFDNILSTRQPILDDIVKDFEKNGRNVWMTGKTGIGKTVMSQRFARMLHGQNRLAGAFFFSNEGPATYRKKSLLGTIGSQLDAAIPGFKDAAQSSLGNRLVDARSLFEPLHRIQGLVAGPAKIVILDGVTQDALPLLKQLIDATASPFQSGIVVHIFITSTPDTRSSAFPDGDSPGPDSMSHLELSEELKKVATNLLTLVRDHSQRSHLDKNWPSDDERSIFTQRAIDSPFYGSTAAEYLANSNYSPNIRLSRLCLSPFRVDSLYSLMIEDAAGVIPASAKYVTYLHLYSEEIRAYPQTSSNSTDFLKKVLSISSAELSRWKEQSHPLLHDAGGGDLRYVKPNGLLVLDIPTLFPPSLYQTWDSWVEEAHSDIAVASLSALTRKAFKTEDSYPALYLSKHVGKAAARDDLRDAILAFDLAKFWRLKPPAISDIYHPRQLFVKLILDFINAANRRFPAIKETRDFVGEFTQRVKDILRDKYDSRDVLVVLTSLELDMTKFISNSIQQSSQRDSASLMWAKFRDGKHLLLKDAQRPSKADPLGLVDSLVDHSRRLTSDVSFFDVLPDAMQDDSKDSKTYGMAALECVTYLCNGTYSLQDRFSFATTDPMKQTFIALPDVQKKAYQLAMYYLGKLLPQASTWNRLGQYLKDNLDLSQIKSTVTGVPFKSPSFVQQEEKAAGAMKEYLRKFDQSVEAGTVETFEIEAKPPRVEEDDTDDDEPDVPPSRPQSVAAVGELPSFPDENRSGDNPTPSYRRDSTASGSSKSDIVKPNTEGGKADNQFDLTDRAKLKATRGKMEKKPPPPPLDYFPLNVHTMESSLETGEERRPEPKLELQASEPDLKRKTKRETPEEGVHSGSCSCCSGCCVA